MGDVFDLVAHLNEEPPAYKILALVHLKPKSTSRSRAANPAPADQEKMGELVHALGAAPQPIPQHLRDEIARAEKQLAGMKKKKK